ncbi:hypothetical protein RHMOL_Rhmol05G0249400 [Rhododendron molle]|uniref:Uncharacterized protein n=1 Tax=Rhododendron molle TaxID=49168 RepID=A0ACC0NUY2_RHOML|nr:hypothetical protein RHMOL_Rhmol05G0249400 [Rhododendron molle]
MVLCLGQHHGNFAADVIAGVSDEIEPCCDDKLVFYGGRVAALLVLAISAPLSHEQHTFSIPPRIFCYAVTPAREDFSCSKRCHGPGYPVGLFVSLQ